MKHTNELAGYGCEEASVASAIETLTAVPAQVKSGRCEEASVASAIETYLVVDFA